MMMKEHEPISNPQSLNEMNFSPMSRDAFQHPEWNSTPALDDLKPTDTSLERDLHNIKKSVRPKAKPLPKINNPNAENRLKALMDLLGKKNAVVTENVPQRANKKRNFTSVLKGKGDLNKVHLPPLTSLTPMPLTEKNMNIAHKEIATGDAKIVIRKKPAQLDSENDAHLLNKKNVNSLIREKPRSCRDLNNPSDDRKLVAKAPDSKVLRVRSPLTGRLSYPINADRSEKDKKNIFLQPPLPEIDFDARIHKVTIDDAFARLDQITNQTGNARKDLLRIQENALAIRLKYERNHRSLERMSVDNKENRNH